MRTPVSFVTGFLGSGKTTLIDRALKDERLRDTAVIVNEFGAVSLDHLLVTAARERVIELRNGCLCCTIREDLAMTLRELHRQRALGEVPPFDHVVVETTGLADPRPMVQTLMANLMFHRAFSVDAVITCVDPTAIAATLETHPTAAAQIAFADLIVLTKSALASPAAAAAARALIDRLNPTAELVVAEKGAVNPDALFRRGLFEGRGAVRRWLGDLRDAPAPLLHDAESAYASRAILRDGPLSLAGTSVFLNRIANEQKDGLLRIKGIAGFRERGGRPAVIHGVQNKFYPIDWLDGWPDDDHRSRFVIIGTAMDWPRCEALFDRLCVA